MQKEKAKADARGERLTFFAGGPIEVRTRSGRIVRVDGLYQADADGVQHLFVRADSRRFTAEQLTGHEDMHAIFAENRGLLLDMVEALYEEQGEAGVARMVDAYVRALDGCYGVYEEGMSEDAQRELAMLYIEDMFADWKGGMNRSSQAARTAKDAAGSVAQRFAGDIENARQNRAGIERRNGPGTRFSIEADTELEEKNITDGNAAVKSLIEQAKTSDNPESLVFEKAMYRSDIGYIDIKWGTPGRGNKFKGGYGLSHIIEKRNAETGDGEKVVYQIVEAIAKATRAETQYSNQVGQAYHRIRLHYNGITAVLSKEPGNNHWLLTGWNENETEASASGEVHDSSAATAVTPTRTRRNGDATVSDNNIAHSSEESNTSEEKNPDAVDWEGNRDLRFSAADEEDVRGVDWLDGSELEDETPPHPSPAATPSPQGEGTGGQIASATETGDADSSTARADVVIGPYGAQNDNEGKRIATPPAEARNDRNGTPEQDGGRSMSGPAEESYAERAREKKAEIAEKASIEGLKEKIKKEEETLRGLKTAERMGLVTEEAKRRELQRRKEDIQETIDIYKEALARKKAARTAEKADKAKRAEARAQRRAEKLAAQKEAELRDNRPRQARKEFRQDALNLFSVPAGKKLALGAILNDFADQMIEQKRISEDDRRDLFRKLYDAGVEIGAADPYFQEIREFARGGKIYVPQEIRNEFGDDWISFNNQAWANGIYFTRNIDDRGADAWNAELAEMFPGSFDANETDARLILENIVALAEEGKGEHVSIEEMMRRNQAETGVTVDEQMDELERKLDNLIKNFGEKAALEVKLKADATMRQVQERRRNREAVERQRQWKQENETRREVMDQIRKLKKMQKRVAPDYQAQINEILGKLDPNGEVGVKGLYGVIDTMARSISPQGLEDLPALAERYEEYKKTKGEDFLPNKTIEERINRLKKIQLDSLTLDQVITLGEAVSGLVTQIQNENRLLADEHHGQIDQSARAVNKQIESAKGTADNKLAKGLEKLYSAEMLDMPRYIEHITGFERGGEGERFAQSLQDATTKESAYVAGADRIFAEFKSNKKNMAWLKKATGKNAEFIEIKVPVGFEKNADGNTVTKIKSYQITPMMRVSLLMHSRNFENLRHIDTTGIKIPNAKWVRAGNMKEALAGADVVKMVPSTVKAIVKECTPEERAFADCLAKYFDEFSKQQINETSIVLDGFYRANVEHYFPIESDKAFLGGSNSAIAYDRSLSSESIGSLKERQHGVNPIVLGDATDILSRHIATFSHYCAFAVPLRDFNEVFSYVFHEDGKPFAGSVMNSIEKKFGSNGSKSIREIQSALAQDDPRSDKAIMETIRKIRGKLASSNLSGNVRVMASQFASLPYALPYLDAQDLLASFTNPVDTEIRDVYSPISQFRRGGYINQELGDMKSDTAYMKSLPVIGTGITAVDTFTINRLWSAAVNHVMRTTELKPGSREQALAGNDPFYTKVAEIYSQAVYKTQPNYTKVQRAAMLRDGDELLRSMFMYKTVSFQVYGMLYEATGRLTNDRARWQQNKNAENTKNYKASQKFFARTQAGVLTGAVLFVAIRALIGGGLFREKKYRDDEDKLNWGNITKAIGKDLLDTIAGSFVGASELLDIGLKLIGESNYNNRIFNDISSLGEIEDAANVLIDAVSAITDGDWQDGKKVLHDAAEEISVLGFGFPTRNIEKFLLSATKWIAPEWADRYENFFDEYERGDLDEENKRFLTASVRVLMDNRTDGLKDETVEELVRLWGNGQTVQVPSAIPSDFTIDNEKRVLSASERSRYRDIWNQTVSGSLEALIASEAYQNADDKDKARMIKKLYDYAGQLAKEAVTEAEAEPWVKLGQACADAGLSLEDYLTVAAVNKDKLKEMDGIELDAAIEGIMRFRIGELDGESLDELGRLRAAGATKAIPGDVPTEIKVNGEEQKLTPEERAAWLLTWKQTAGEGLDSVIGSKLYQDADDKGKEKMLGDFYTMAKAMANAAVKPEYEASDRWITAGIEAQKMGVPMDEYVLCYEQLSNASSAKNKIQILKEQGWDDRQKEKVWLEALASETQTKKYENLKNGGASWADAMTVMDIGGDATEGLTEAQTKVYNQRWEEITANTTKRLMQTRVYKNATAEVKETLVDKLNTYASAVAKAEATKTASKETWVNAGISATRAGVKLEEYIVFTNQLSKIDGKDESGESVDGLRRNRELALLNATGWTDKQKEIVFLESGMTDKESENKERALRNAGLTWMQTSDIMGTMGSTTDKAYAVINSGASDDVVYKALEVYLNGSTLRTAQVGINYRVDLKYWASARKEASTDGNNSVSQEEATAYIDNLNLGWEDKAYLWQMVCYSSRWMKNPYSTTFGKDIWYSLHPEE